MDQLNKVKDYYKECDKSYQHWGEEEIYNIHYGFWNKKTKNHVQSLNNMNKAMAESLKIKSGDKILDAGCGVGATTIWIAKNYDVEVVGITISEFQCKKAIGFAKKAGVSDKVKFYTKDYQNTGFANESFNAIWSLESLCHGNDKNKFIKECHRILKKDGRMAVADFYLKKPYIKLNRIQKLLIDRFVFGWKLAGLWSTEEIMDECTKTGFRNVKCVDITKNIIPSAKNIFKRGYKGYLHDKYIEKRTPTQMAHVASNVYQGLALKAGAWRYQIIYADK